MDDGNGRHPFYERRGFQGTVAVVSLAAALTALVGAPTPWSVAASIFFPAGVAVSNTEIVLDTSAAMGQRFAQGETKLDAAVRAIEQSSTHDEEGLALRRTSAICGGDGELLVDFGTDHEDAVLTAAREQRPSGSSAIVSAVLEALGDFRNEPSFNGPRSTRRVLVFTAGDEDCFEGDVARRIESELKGADVRASFTLIALRPSGPGLEGLAELEGALRSADAFVETRTPDTPGQLEDVVDDVDRDAEEAIEEGLEEPEISG